MRRIGLVGPAGRDARLWSRDTADFGAMVAAARDAIAERKGVGAVCLVSGGAAWSDHVAVRLFLDGAVAGLELVLPCAWTGSAFAETKTGDWRTDPGRLANAYHRRFSACIGASSLREVGLAVEKGARVVVANGFHQRNAWLARSVGFLFAFTFDGRTPGGTGRVWKACRCVKRTLPIRGSLWAHAYAMSRCLDQLRETRPENT